jgi:hypothetical protein
MTTTSKRATVAWRWVLVVAEFVVASYLLVSRLVAFPADGSMSLTIGFTAVFVAWAFLFFGAPFLVRSHGWLAILGWCIAASVFLFPRL